LSELKELEQKYGELKDKYDEILQLQRQQTSLINRIAEQIEKVIKEMREGH
jgi:predicted transcriptional regulator